jgi:hypothetical protein
VTYLRQSIVDFQSVASMVAATTHVDGDLVKTLGYYAAGDGGGNSYIYHSTGRPTADGGFYIDGPGADDYFEALDRTFANVKQFGAGPTENNYAAFTGAISTMSPVIVPSFPGESTTYEFDETVLLNTHAVIIGYNRPILTGGNSLSAIFEINDASTIKGQSLPPQLKIEGISFRNADRGIYFNDQNVAQECLFTNLQFASCSVAGVHARACSIIGTKWEMINATGCGYGFLINEGSNTAGASFHNLHLTGNTTAAFAFIDDTGGGDPGAISTTIYSSIFEANDAYGFYLRKGRMILHSCYFEANGDSDIYLKGDEALTTIQTSIVLSEPWFSTGVSPRIKMDGQYIRCKILGAQSNQIDIERGHNQNYVIWEAYDGKVEVTGPDDFNRTMQLAKTPLQPNFIPNITANNNGASGSTVDAFVATARVTGVQNDADDWITLPSVDDLQDGHSITVVCNAGSNFEIRTPASSGEKINGVDCDGTNEYLATDTDIIKLTKVSDDQGWIAQSFDALGQLRTAIVPD